MDLETVNKIKDMTICYDCYKEQYNNFKEKNSTVIDFVITMEKFDIVIKCWFDSYKMMVLFEYMKELFTEKPRSLFIDDKSFVKYNNVIQIFKKISDKIGYDEDFLVNETLNFCYMVFKLTKEEAANLYFLFFSTKALIIDLLKEGLS
jgi:hypothetical protein